MPNVSDRSPKGADKMSTAEQARHLLIAAAGPRAIGEGVKVLLTRASIRLGISFRRARAIYHGEARLIGADEWESMKCRAAEANIKEEWARAEHASLAMDLCERIAASPRDSAVVRQASAPARQEGGWSRADAASRPAE